MAAVAHGRHNDPEKEIASKTLYEYRPWVYLEVRHGGHGQYSPSHTTHPHFLRLYHIASMAFRATRALFYRFYKTSTSIMSLPSSWQTGVHKALTALEKELPRFTQAEIKGGPHMSTYEPDAGQPVVSVRLRTDQGTRIATAHIRLDGTFTRR
ncbi:hypothetical protein BC835DRAFT_1377380 [Cytidiella melzeri]|nr:hypothetical protein BC835DRAFT_1377380 [Cytidiella melzeri]